MLLEAVNKHSDKMDKIIRYRRAFYEKENDLRNGNRRREVQKVCDKLPLSHSLLSCASSSAQYCNIYAESLLAIPLVPHSPHFLEPHSIDGPLRARMLDWMVEVVHSYKFSHKTYFASAQLMDRYFQSEKDRLPVSKLHIVGSEALLIASKMEEVFPLKIKVVHEKIVHKKISVSQLVEMEAKMMKQLNYQLGTWTFFDMALLKLTAGLVDLSDSAIKDLEDICSYVSKFILYDYELYCEFSPAMFAEVLVKMSMEIQKLACPETLVNPTREVEECMTKVVKAGKCFGVTHKGLPNTLKYTPKTVIFKVGQYFATE